MSFLWPWALLALLLLPPLVWVYLRALRRPAEGAALHADLLLIARASGGGRRVKRHVPAALYLLAVVLALVAFARPTAPLPVPDDRAAIMLAIDVSLSMDAEDIEPNRFFAAQEAAREFVRSLPRGARVGLVSFAGYSVVNMPPTAEHDQVLSAIDTLTLGHGTAIGEGLTSAVRSLPDRDADSRQPGRLPPAFVVLLSDGRNNQGVEPLMAAALARDLDVRVYTVGLGTEDGALNFGGQFGGFYVGFDAETLMAIADTTGGEYYEANTAGELGSIYRTLGRSIAWTVRPAEVSGLFAALSGLMLLVSLVSSERIHRRIL